MARPKSPPPIAPAAAACRSARARNFEDIDKVGGRQAIIVTELPYQVNKARLLERIAELVRNKEIDGISELRDESDKDGMRVVIELKRGEVSEVVLNNLFAQTPLETVFGINMVALIDGRPKLLGLKEMLEAFLRHRREIVTRRTIFDLAKARDRAHILEGLAVALANIDEIIALIKASPTPVEAKAALAAREWNSGVGPAAARARRRHLDAAAGPRRGVRHHGCGRRATSSPRSRPRPFSTCACTASRASSRTRSSPNTRSCWPPSSTSPTSLRVPSASCR